MVSKGGLQKRQLPKLMACMTKTSLENLRNKALFSLDVLDAKENTKKECLELLKLALYYAEKEKGILWLAEKFFLASIAVSSQYLIDGGRQKAVCKYHYAKFLLEKFPGADPEEPFLILTEVRDSAIGKVWPLYEAEKENEVVPPVSLFCATALELHNVLLSKARAARKLDPGKAERLSRLAERRAKDAGETAKTAEAIIEIGVCQLTMNNLNNAQKTFERAFKIHAESSNIEGICLTRMHLAAVMQRLGDHETAAKLLTEMGAMAMENNLRRLLGQALHLLGELHLRRERPDLGTPHLAEAFACFIGYKFKGVSEIFIENQDDDDGVYVKKKKETFEEEAEQARLMTAISAGQELMSSYFNLIRESGTCAVAKMKTIEWKLSGTGWWVKKRHHDFLPCLCPNHHRTPLDILRIQLEAKQSMILKDTASEFKSYLGRENTIEDMRRLRSDYPN